MDKVARSVTANVTKYIPTTSRPFVDIKLIKCIGGKGGNGALAFSKHGPHHLVGPGLPAGGRGGNGGSIFAEPVRKLNERSDFSSIPSVIKAKNGFPGKGNRTNGNPGEDVILKMPLGTMIYKFEPVGDLENWRMACKDWNKTLISDMDSVDGERVLLAEGGLGGLGNNLRNPYEAEEGKMPQEYYYKLELKLIADIGLLGLPNVGKSTLFSSITRGTSKIGNYPFTTLAPYVGHIQFNDGINLSLVDLPGIVDSSPNNAFLTHLERVKLIIYIIDPCNPVHTCIDNFKILRNKLIEYNLNNKPFLIVTSKMDIASRLSSKQTDQLQEYIYSIGVNKPVIPTSAKYNMGLEKLVVELRRSLESSHSTQF